jgi:hypothetical protein
LKEELFSSKAQLLRSKEMNETYSKAMPKIYKETRKEEILAMIGAPIITILNIIMRKTQQLTRLRALFDAVFTKELFGSVATERVMKDATRQYARKHIFSLGKCFKHWICPLMVV